MLNFSEVKTKVKELSQKNGREPVVSVAQAADKISLEAVKMLNSLELGRAMLFGDEQKIRKIADEVGLDLAENLVINVAPVEQAALAAAKAVGSNEADVLVKGHLHTKTFLRALLNRDAGLRTGDIISSVTAVESKALDRMILASDCAMIINPDINEKIAIIKHAVELAQALDCEVPKVSMLSAVEELSPNMPDGYDSAIITQMNRRGQIKNCIVDGPLSLDLSISPFSAENKGIDSEVAGHADILVMPNIQAGNIFWKSMTYLAFSKTGAVVMGAKKPVVLTSRSDSSENKLDSIALALLLADKQNS